jgi:hypothetical protein
MSKGKFSNSKQLAHLAAIPEEGVEATNDTLTVKCKFNFAYFFKQDGVGKDIGDLTAPELHDLFDKVRNFCREPLLYWEKQKHGRGSTLAIYKNFPVNSDFTHPKHVPNDVHWGRFRLSGEVRLVGFVVPSNLHGTLHGVTKVAFDCNTFYVVFIDHDHRFYISNKHP